jgi:hypothetical protein
VISTDIDAGSRTTQTLFGFGMVLGGIAPVPAQPGVTRYTFIGIKRYIQMNFPCSRAAERTCTPCAHYSKSDSACWCWPCC